MTKAIGVFFGNKHDPERNTAPFSPVFRVLHNAGIPTYTVTGPEAQLAETGVLNAHELRVVGGKTVAIANEDPMQLDKFSLILDRTGTLKLKYPMPVINDPIVRRIGQGKEGDRSALATSVGVEHDFSYAGPIDLGDEFESAVQGMKVVEGLRIYSHVGPDTEELWAPVVVGEDADGKTLYVPVDKEIIPETLITDSRKLTQVIADQAGVSDAFSAPSWSLINGTWVATAPNTGNVQFGTASKKTHPDAYLSRQNLGSHLVHIMERQAA